MKLTVKEAENKVYTCNDFGAGEFGLCVGHKYDNNTMFVGTIILGVAEKSPTVVYAPVEKTIGTSFTNNLFRFVKIRVEEIVINELQ